MSYQPYPSAGGSNVVQRPPQPQPQSVRIAVILMYVGAGLSVLGLIGTLVLSGRIKKAVGTALVNARTRAGKPYTAAQIHAGENFYLTFVIVVLLIAVGLWLWMAWANGKGRGWARITSSAFFGLYTLWVIFSASRTVSTAVLAVLSWLVGLAAVIFLWRRETTEYISTASRLAGP
jgi:hypothetical protein